MTDRRPAKNTPERLLHFVLLALGLLAALAGCGRKQDGYGGTAVLALLAEPAGLNPLVNRDIAANIPALLFNGLTKLDEKLAPVPDLAESWETSADGLAWTFHLKKGVKFHDGTELTSRDVVFTIRSFADPEVSPQLGPLFGALEGVEALSTYDVRVTLKTPYAPMLYLLTVEVLPAHLLEAGGRSAEAVGKSPVGTGPFRFKEWTQGEITLVANTEHFAGRPYLDSVLFRSYAARGTAWSELMQGKVDMVPDLQSADYDIIKDDARFQVQSYLDLFYYTLLFNTEDPLLREPRFREAIDLAVDRKDIIADALEGLAEETTGPFLPGTWAYDPDLASSTHDPGKAQELLASLGWKDSDADGTLDKAGKQLELSLLVDKGDSLKVTVAQRIKWQLYGIGIKVNVEFLDPQALMQERLFPGRFQMTLLQFNAAGDPDTFMYLFWHSGRIGSSNLARYASAEVDRLIEQGRVESDVQKRAELYHAVHRVMAQDRPAVFLFVPKRLVGMSSRLTGVRADPVSLYGSSRTWKIGTTTSVRR